MSSIKSFDSLPTDNTINNSNKLFIVPNNDGEAVEIQNLLASNNIQYIVTNQVWGASWDNLEQEMKDSINEFSGTIYGIELQGKPLNNNCINIDHHKYSDEDRSNPLSSLEQVAQNIGVELTYFQKAISDRDKGHIALLRENHYSDDIIQLVGQLDRKAQGITEEQEMQSLKVCRKVFDIIQDKIIYNLAVTLPHGKCQTIRDVLYDNYKNIIIFSPDNEFNYYGKGNICVALHNKFGGWLSSSATISSRHGFAGGYAPKEDVLAFLASLGEEMDLSI